MAIEYNPEIEQELPLVANDPIKENDQDIKGKEILHDADEVVKVAGLGKGISKVVKPVTDFFDSSADVLVSPKVKKAKEKASEEDQVIIDQAVDENPLAVVNKGRLLIRNANPDEMQLLNEYANTPVPIKSSKEGGKKEKYRVNDVILPNLDNVKSLDGDDDSLRQFVAQTYLAYKDKKGIDGKTILEKGKRGFAEIIQDANKIGSVDVFLELMQRKKGDRVFTDAELLASAKTVSALQINAKSLLDKAVETGDLLDMAKATQAIAIEGYATIQLTKLKEDAGRVLVTNRILPIPSENRSGAMASMLEAVDDGTGKFAVIDI